MGWQRSRAHTCQMFLVFIFALVSAAAAQQASPAHASPQTFRISGTVVNSLTGQALDKAEVSIGKAQGNDAAQAVTTGEDGRFEFVVKTAEKFWLRAERKGFSRQAFEEHEGFFTGIVTGRGFDTEHLVFRLRPDASIVGTILDDGDEPVRGAQVVLFRRQTQEGRLTTSQQAGTMTNDEGHYRFGHLLPGTYYIMVQAQPWYSHVSQGTFVMNDALSAAAPDQILRDEPQPSPPQQEARSPLEVAYPLTYYSGATEAAGATPLVLNPGEQATADLRLNAVPAPRLKVHHPDLKPLEPWNANLLQRGFDNEEIPVQAQVGGIRDGELEITGIPPGDYELKLQNYGKNPRTWTQNISLRGDADVTVEEEQTAAPVSVRGVIRMEGAQTVKEAYVQLWNRATEERLGAQTSDKGEFEIPPQAVAPGSYEVMVSNAPGALVSGIAAKGAKVAGQNIVLGGAGAVELTITLQRGLGQVDGVVLQDGKPMAGAMVVLVPRDPQDEEPLFRRDQSDMDGTFTLRDVLPGTYTVVAIRDAWDLDWMNPELLQPLVKAGEKIEVAPKGKLVVKVTVQDASASIAHR